MAQHIQMYEIQEVLGLKVWPPRIGANVAIGQHRGNHSNCTAGVDTKRRLYVKVTEDSIVGYCHHCGGKYRYYDRAPRATASAWAKPVGTLSGSVFERYQLPDEPKLTPSRISGATSGEDYINAYLGVGDDVTMWPLAGVDALAKYPVVQHIISDLLEDDLGERLCLQDVVQETLVRWDGDLNRVAVPTIDNSSSNNLLRVAYKATPLSHGPKSLAWVNREAPHKYAISVAKTGRVSSERYYGCVAIVEDQLSASLLAMLGIHSLALHGTSWDIRELYEILMEYNPRDVLVWFDNDNPGVIAQSKRLTEELAFITGLRTTRVAYECDPKRIDTLLVRRLRNMTDLTGY